MNLASTASAMLGASFLAMIIFSTAVLCVEVSYEVSQEGGSGDDSHGEKVVKASEEIQCSGNSELVVYLCSRFMSIPPRNCIVTVQCLLAVCKEVMMDLWQKSQARVKRQAAGRPDDAASAS